MIHESKGGSLFKRTTDSVHNLDIFTYVNSKFVYVEKHLRNQMKSLYLDVIKQRCALERETIKNSLAIASQSPDEFAYNLMKGPGFMALVSGEVVHIIQCVPVELKVLQGDKCYAQLQVTRNNQTWFLTPKTHILIRRGVQIICNPALPAYFRAGNTWYKMMPRPVESIPPMVINPIINATWTYQNPGNLATRGIYTDKDLEQLRDHMYQFPHGKAVVA